MADLPSSTAEVRYRRFGGEADFPGLNTVFNEARRADGVEVHSTLEEFTNHYRHLTNCDLAEDLLVVEDDDGIGGYARVTWWIEEATGMRVLIHIGWLVPSMRGGDRYATMARWCELRLTEIAAKTSHDGPQTLASFADAGATEWLAVLDALGYQPYEFYAEMSRDLSTPLPDCGLPEGLEIRPVTWDDAAVIWEHNVEAFRDHSGFAAATEADYERWRNEPTADPALWKVAFCGDEIVGHVLNFVNVEENAEFGRKRGYTETIATRRDWRGRGVAKALIADSMRMFLEMGMTETALTVHTENPTGAFMLYEGLGYTIAGMNHELRRPLNSGRPDQTVSPDERLSG